ncbi:alpha-amylase family glycosyl hydrolase [Romboutsia sedimentorum]|uniref:Alpha-amylase family glycosyl hydrolase n=1 Tax=Romboutsia sedimentorum TaxID=1368474 RepID=A0ABT7E9Z6_9FIRM|nr:alpha-amylase family glycosyl hydrolase [Romboutsia sedimentorum]MDK2563747.1 alpha-amylase family glycosyl hydrolase [Romboutsia sedimentorum]
MFEYTSDDGFSVVDYMEIDKKLGEWETIKSFSNDYRLMFDFVANHISKSSKWFKGYLNGDEKYKEYFIKRDENFDYSKVVRPRTSPIIHAYKGKEGVKTAWTTFSEDQLDINIKHFPVLIETTGTTCIHLPQTHSIIQLWRLILDYFKPNTQIITETNVPHKENISYFGDKSNEAHMVYQFTLPPLTLYTLTTHDSTKLTKWARSIDKVSGSATYFTTDNGGKVSYKNNPDGSKSVYELNINYLDALINKDEDVSEEIQVQKILSAHAILLSFVGIHAIYYHSLLGSKNYYKGVEESGINRRINREKLEYNDICEQLEKDSRRKKYLMN